MASTKTVCTSAFLSFCLGQQLGITYEFYGVIKKKEIGFRGSCEKLPQVMSLEAQDYKSGI